MHEVLNSFPKDIILLFQFKYISNSEMGAKGNKPYQSNISSPAIHIVHAEEWPQVT